jgi:hypothetical protein
LSNAWYYYVVPLAISAGFVFAGIWSLCLYWLGGRTPDGKRRVGLVAALVGALFGFGVGGSVGIPFLLHSPTPWQREELMDHILRTPPEHIERFIIKPGHANQYKPLTPTEVVIDDPARIRQIAEMLRTAPEVSPNHPHARWTAEVTMVTRDGTYSFGVYATVPGDSNGTLVSPWTTEQGGWNLGDVRADGLDEALEDAVNKAR